jgi:hypothetical protein
MSHGFAFERDAKVIFVGGRSTFFFLALHYLQMVIADEPLWCARYQIGQAQWVGPNGESLLQLCKPFYDSFRGEPTPSEETIQYDIESCLEQAQYPYPSLGFSQRELKGELEGELPELRVVANLVLAALKEYDSHRYPFIHVIRKIDDHKNPTLIISRPAGLFFFLQALRMAAKKNIGTMEFDRVVLYRSKTLTPETWHRTGVSYETIVSMWESGEL